MNALGAVLAKHGPLGVAVLVLAYLLMRQGDSSKEERAYNAMAVMDTIGDLKLEIARLHEACGPRKP